MARTSQPTKQLTHDDYTVAWICALPIEKTAARNMLDEFHLPPPQPEHDSNIYTLGSTCGHNVVIVCQGDMGTTAAAVVATQMVVTFRKLRFGLLVGIAGGVPDMEDIRLGDVVVSKEVVVHDRGKETPNGFEPRPFLNGVPELLKNAFSELESLLMDRESKITQYVSNSTARNPCFSAFERPTLLIDNLFDKEYIHLNPGDKTCSECDKSRLIWRDPRHGPKLHFGIVASGNQVIKSGIKRGKILEAHPGVMAIEMEAAGLMNVFGCATIRGICDYADSHKNDGWHKYASAVAAAAAKEILSIILPPIRATCINVTTSLSHVNNRAGHNFKMPYGSGSDLGGLPFGAETYGLDQSLPMVGRKSSDTTSFDHKGSLGLNTLFTPSEPLIEYVFVHGLGGGSTESWSIEPDPSYFWPKDWLPRHVSFRNVRIHSFGYNSVWGRSVPSIHGSGQALLLAIQNSPFFRLNPIVFVAHSTGGLVIKEAYILARQDPTCQELAMRISAMVFLATPHRGSNQAVTLNNILRVSIVHSFQSYVSGLQRSTETSRQLNDAFLHYCNDLILYSYFETVESRIMGSSTLIVDRDSSVMAYPGERVSLLNADHLGICKFRTPKDANYLIITDAFQTINAEIMNRLSAQNPDRFWPQLQQIETYLGTPETPADDLKDFEELRMPGSCEWFTNRIPFQIWLNGSVPKLYWVHANPATGKSVLASHIINILDSLNHANSYYFFRHGVRSTLSGCLRSIAYQMAVRSASVKSKLLSMIEREIRFDKDDAKMIWRKIFLSFILEAEFPQPQFWVIDALDECSEIPLLFNILSQLKPEMPVKIFLTSRRMEEIATGFGEIQQRSGGKAAIYEEISFSDTKDDILMFLCNNIQKIHVENEDQRREFVNKILEKSQGCFLWVRLVLDELSRVWTSKQIEHVLEEVPQEMDTLYTRAVRSMAAKPKHTFDIARAILTWTVCAVRPMTVVELQSALELDIGTTIHDPENAIPFLCAQVVYVDKSSRVLMVHLTAKTFLQDSILDSPFTICPIQGHQRLAHICLRFLASDEMKPPRIRRSSKIQKPPPNKFPFMAYASLNFAEHMRKATSNNQVIAPLLYEFLQKNVFTWIEYVASDGSLHRLTSTANMMKNYLQRQSQIEYFPLLGEQAHLVESWAVDLHRLVAKFGNNLLGLPPSIHWLIPPFCPRSSAISRGFGTPRKRIKVVGITDNGWDDRLACIDSQDKQAFAVACGEGFFAVGFLNSIVIYYATTCQEWRKLDHRSQLRQLGFDSSGNILVSVGKRDLKIWALERGILRWSFETSHDILSFSFADKEKSLIVALKNNFTIKCLLDSDEITEGKEWKSTFEDESHFRRPPLLAAFSPNQALLAVVYRGRPITIWDLDCDDLHGYVGRENRELSLLALGTNTSPSSLVFNSEESIPLLAAAYEDGDLCLFDYEELKLLKMIEANAQIIACSPNGTTLATGNSAGMVQLFEFETLQLLFRVNATDYGIRCLSFSSDNLRFLDVRGTQCNVWEPALTSGPGRKGDASSNPRIVGLSDGEVEITTIAIEISGDYFFVGKSDGSVNLYETADGHQLKTLYRHGYEISITRMVYGNDRNILVTADAAGRFIVCSLEKTDQVGFVVHKRILDIRGDIHQNIAISQVLLNPANNLLLVSTTKTDAVWDLSTGCRTSCHEFISRPPFYWANHPFNGNYRALISTTGASLWDWKTSTVQTTEEKLVLRLDATNLRGEGVKNVNQAFDGKKIVVEYSKLYTEGPTTNCLLLDSIDFRNDCESLVPSRGFGSISPNILHLIGMFESRIVFLNKEFWVCSVCMLASEAVIYQYVKHFFIPSNWYNKRRTLIIRITNRGDILFGLTEEVAVIKDGLKFEEEILEVEESGREIGVS